MAAKKKGEAKKLVRKVDFTSLQKLGAAVCLLSFVVMLASGVLAGVPIVTVAFRACIAMVVVKIIFRIVVSIFATYEETHSGQA